MIALDKLITKDYKRQLNKMHRKGYGDSAGKWKYCINELIRVYGIKTMLDYGCGQGVLKNHVPKHIIYQGYDPAGDKMKCKAPVPAELVICLDVLEHIELEFLDNVFVHLRLLIKKVGFLVIAQQPATQILEDGRNAHLILESPEWWYKRIGNIMSLRFNVVRHYGQTLKKDLVFLLEKK